MSMKFIELDPPHILAFQRPFNTPKSRILKIKNTTDSTIVFKVKTTAPNNYIVVPNCGEVKVNEVRNVEIKRNATNEEFPPDFKCKDKFLVQSIKISDEEITKYNTSPKDLQTYLMSKFQEIDKQKKINPNDVKQILGEDRLTCVYQLPNDTSSIPEVGSNEELGIGSSRESLNTVAANSSVTANNTPNPTEAIPASVISSTLAATSPKDSSYEELVQAREKIKELQQALKGFQQDKAVQESAKNTKSTASAKETPATTTVVKKANPNKNVIPVEIVAIVALLAFLIGAFCF